MKGLLFTPEMAVATLRAIDPKNNTRRVISPQPKAPGPQCAKLYRRPDGLSVWCSESGVALMPPEAIKCDYKVGERRCLLTTWSVSALFDHLKPTELDLDQVRITGFWHAGLPFPKMQQCGKLRPGRFLPNHLRPLMPVFEVVSVRAERVQDISQEDAKAEGVEPIHDNSGLGWPCGWKDYLNPDSLPFDHDKPKASFRSLWDSINADRKDDKGKRLPYTWADNPWIWAIAFRRVAS